MAPQDDLRDPAKNYNPRAGELVHFDILDRLNFAAYNNPPCWSYFKKFAEHLAQSYKQLKTVFDGTLLGTFANAKAVDNIIACYKKELFRGPGARPTTSQRGDQEAEGTVKGIGYSIDNFDDASSKAVKDFYKDYTVTADNCSANQLIGASYFFPGNSLSMPAGIIQVPILNPENLEFVNYTVSALLADARMRQVI
ncbi:hypothetical protein BKA57DRAFT_510966 [Linnemannia elongata]|nr:hypothetical protein BKA57DRAFT_510966 [Linnemannia elongata]